MLIPFVAGARQVHTSGLLVLPQGTDRRTARSITVDAWDSCSVHAANDLRQCARGTSSDAEIA